MLRTKSRPFILPYEPEYTAHRTSKRQVQNGRMLMHVYTNAIHESPPIAPDLPEFPDALVPMRLRTHLRHEW